MTPQHQQIRRLQLQEQQRPMNSMFRFLDFVVRNMVSIVRCSCVGLMLQCSYHTATAFTLVVSTSCRNERWLPWVSMSGPSIQQQQRDTHMTVMESISVVSTRSRTKAELRMTTGSSSSISKTGGRLLESTDDYTKFVMDNTMDQPVLVFWTAPWCGPCRLSVPVVKDIIHLFTEQISAVEVCTDDLPDLAANAGVVSIPTIQIYFRGMWFPNKNTGCCFIVLWYCRRCRKQHPG
jgi:thiol-disulfide isomerase/thioredoxin